MDIYVTCTNKQCEQRATETCEPCFRNRCLSSAVPVAGFYIDFPSKTPTAKLQVSEDNSFYSLVEATRLIEGPEYQERIETLRTFGFDVDFRF